MLAAARRTGVRLGVISQRRWYEPVRRVKQAIDAVFVEWKVPSFAFTKREVQVGYFEEVTNIIQEMSDGKQPKENIYINVLHAMDGAWNFDGKAMTNAEIGAAISKG